MASCHDGNVSFFGVAINGESDGARSLVVNEVGLKIVEHALDFWVGVEAEMETVFVCDARNSFAKNFDSFGDFADLVWIEWEFFAWKASDTKIGIGVGFDFEVTGYARGEHDDFMAALAEADGKIS